MKIIEYEDKYFEYAEILIKLLENIFIVKRKIH
jgi:hypothetical protein